MTSKLIKTAHVYLAFLVCRLHHSMTSNALTQAIMITTVKSCIHHRLSCQRNVEEYHPVSRYHNPDVWGQLTSPVTKPWLCTLNSKWFQAGTAQCSLRHCHYDRNLIDTSESKVTNSLSTQERSLQNDQMMMSTTCSRPENLAMFSCQRFERIHSVI